VQSRTLELYRQLGISDEVVEEGFQFPSGNIWVNHKKRARFPFSATGTGLTPFPFVTIYPQDQHERLLIRHLEELGLKVERRTELADFSASEDGVEARIRLPSGETETVRASYLAGCDGARSTVREKLGVGFSGSTYPGMFYVADVEGEGAVFNGELHVSLEKAEFLAVFPLKQPGHARLIGVIRTQPGQDGLHWGDVSPRIFRELDIKIAKINWFSTYHVHHRVASSFKKGRVFLLGDAGHIHSPVGGQGMNTGIGDAVNLAWKLGEVLKGRAGPELLESYNSERIAFAGKLVKTVDLAFRFIISPGPLARFIRTRLAPIFLKIAMPRLFVRRLMFRLISQTGITYRTTSGRGLQPGDRLPWIESVDNYAPLQRLEAQIHIYGERGAVADAAVPIHRFPWNEEMERKKLRRGALYRIRPDGYIRSVEL
jgi:2-polyprenyl-6-methoxyphenol hydroxylase-like FAD-dependent oxidoreductase